MRLTLLVLAMTIVTVLFFTPHNAGAQCLEDEDDLGICDTLYVETFDCDHIYEADPGWFDSVRVAVYVTHDSNTFWWEGGNRWVQDSITAFVIPLTFWHQPPGCADSVILPTYDSWNNTAIDPYNPTMPRSLFRDIVDVHTGDTVYNRLLWMASQPGVAAWNVNLDIESHSSDGDSGHAWFALTPIQSNCQRWWEGSRVLIATLTFHVYMPEDCDTTEIGLDSTFWPPANRLIFTRYDAVSYSPRHFLPVKDTIYSIPNLPPEITCPNPEIQHTNGTFTTTTTWYAFDPESALVVSPTCQAPGGPIPTCNVSVDWSTAGSAEGTVEYSVTDHGSTGTYYIVLTTMDDEGGTGICSLAITVVNNPPVLDAIGNQKFNEGDYIVLNVDAFDLDGDSLVFTASNLPEGAHFYGGNGVFLWTPTYAQYGTYPNIHFEVSDGQGGTDSEDITIEILNYPQGDVTDDGMVDVSDVIYLINFLFINGPAPEPLEAGDANCDGVVNIADAVHLINYLFINGPVPCAPPSPRFILPKSNGSVNGLVWVSVENLSDTPAQEVRFDYSADSAVWNELIFDEREPPGSPGCYDHTGRTYQGSWNTEDLESGDYWLRVTMRDTVHNIEGAETIPIVIDKDPTPVITVAYDPPTGIVFFDASSSYDPEGSVIWWEWIFCDTSTYQGSVIQKEFVPGDSCQVNLTVYDGVYNRSTSYNMLVVAESEATIEGLTECTCLSLTVQATGQIPPDSDLDFGNTDAPNPKGGKVLGPVDHHEKDSTGNDIPLGSIQLYYMVEATVEGNPECCSTIQYNNITLLYDGPLGPGPNGMRVFHNGGQPFDPANPNNPQNPPANATDLDPDDYNTDCNCSWDRPTGPLEKKSLLLSSPSGVFLFGAIRWIDAPGWTSADPPDFRPSGAQIFDFKMFEVINYPACNTGCEKCIVWKAAYNKDRDRQDVTGDGNPDPPTITDPDANCP